MKKLLLVLSIMVIGLSGCFVRGHHDDGYHRGHDRDRGHDDRRGDRDDKHDGKHDGRY